MKSNKLIAGILSAVMAVCSAAPCFVSAETTEADEPLYTLSYDLDTETTECEDFTVFDDVQLKHHEMTNLPEDLPKREGYFLTGWTIDGVFAYEPGDVFMMPDEDVVFKPVWMAEEGKNYTLSYSVFYDDEEHIDFTVNKNLSTAKYMPGQIYHVAMNSFSRTGYCQIGWTDGENDLYYQAKLIMPAHDVTLTPCWHKYYSIRYDAGDVDRVIGDSAYVFNDRYEGLVFDLALPSRLSRAGFNLTGWLCEYDGQVYKTGSFFTMPGCNVTFYAVWTPKDYNIVFRSTVNGAKENVLVSGKTDTTIICPEPPNNDANRIFAGWKFDGDDNLYQPGDEYLIRGAAPGLGIVLNAQWMTQDEYDEYIKENTFSSLDLVKLRKMAIAGEGDVTLNDLKLSADFLLGR